MAEIMNFDEARKINHAFRRTVVCGCILTALNLSGGGSAWALDAVHDFSRYQVILDKKPFGEVAPSEDAQPQAALGDIISRELEMKAIIDDGSSIRIGLLDKKTNKNFFLAVGESHEGLQLVSVDYDNEEALLEKNGETAVVKLRPEKDIGKEPAPAAASALMSKAPFQMPAQTAPATRRPFFSDLQRRRTSPFQPSGTNLLPFQARSAESFFKVSTGAFPHALSPFGPLPQGGAVPGIFQPITPSASNMPGPFAPISPAGGQVSPSDQNVDSKGPTIDQLLQQQTLGEGQTQPAVIQFPVEYEMPAE